MKIVDYPIVYFYSLKTEEDDQIHICIHVTREGDLRCGYQLELEFPKLFSRWIKLSSKHPSWKRIRFVHELKLQFVRIAAFNHNNLEHRVPDHEIREVHLCPELFSHLTRVKEGSCRLFA